MLFRSTISERSQPAVVAVEQFAVVAPQVHAAALAVAEHRAIGAFAPARPFAVAERLEAVLPHVPEPIPVDVSLMVVGADRRARDNRAYGLAAFRHDGCGRKRISK